MLCPTTRPMSCAAFQCSTRMLLPWYGKAATSPAANATPGFAPRTRRNSSTSREPSSRVVTPLNLMVEVLGLTPTPRTTTSAGSTVPSDSSTPVTFPPSDRKAVTRLPMRSFTPFFSCSPPSTLPTSPSTACMGVASMPTMVTSSAFKFFLMDDAASMPIKDAPMTTTLLPGSLTAFAMAVESAGERRVCTPVRLPPGSCTAREPGAMTTWSKDRV
mmetsp:Transcript_48683/g.122492  ORF Transcript_48683/g.122492 Transcript_48683/m.122492 type:complete len:216 (-) Transcript_48683:831-1478(-)